MPSKRQRLSFPELEPKGKGAILRSAEEVAAETQMLESQQTGKPDNQFDSMSGNQDAGNRAHYTKATYRLSPEALDAIDDTKRILRRQYNIKVTFEEIAEHAILAVYQDLVENQQASILANTFSAKPDKQKPR